MLYGLALDILIVVLLMAVIVYATRLSLHLKRFRDSKSILENIVTDLSLQIEKANSAIIAMRDAAEKGGRDLQERMNRANAMFDELQSVVEAGDALATRLEKLATYNTQPVETSKNTYSNGFIKKNTGRNADSATTTGVSDALSSIFTIRDLDIERGEDVVDSFILDDDNVDFFSDAEHDLYQAMKTRKSRTGARK